MTAGSSRQLPPSSASAANLIVTPDGLRIVDWAFMTKAAPWAELALLVQWLIGSGHTPEQAEAWLARFPAWQEINAEVLDDFASRNGPLVDASAQGGAHGTALRIQPLHPARPSAHGEVAPLLGPGLPSVRIPTSRYAG